MGGGIGEHRLDLVQPVGHEQRMRELLVPDDDVGRELDGCLRFVHRGVELIEPRVGRRQVVVRNPVLRIRADPQLIGRDDLIEAPGDDEVIRRGDEEALGLAEPFAALEGALHVLLRFRLVGEVRVNRREARGGQREVRVEGESAFEQRDRLHLADTVARVEPHAVRLERFERCRRRVLNRHVETLNRSKRFAELLAQSGGGGSDAGQDVGFRCRLHLLPRHDVARSARLRFQLHDVRAVERCNRSQQDGFGADALAEIVGDLGRYRFARRLLHQPQRRVYLRGGQHVHVRRLLQLDFERILERAVEHRLTGRVDEVGQQQWFARGERRRGAVKPRIADIQGRSEHQ